MPYRSLTYAHSPDGLWWWDGDSWRPAYSPDRRWWFDGQSWVAAGPSQRGRLRTTATENWKWLAWCGLLGVGFLVIAGMVGVHKLAWSVSAPASTDTVTPFRHLLGYLALAAALVGLGQGLGTRLRTASWAWWVPLCTGLLAAAVGFFATATFVQATCVPPVSCDISGVPAGVSVGAISGVVLIPALLLGWVAGWGATEAWRRRAGRASR